MTELHELCNFIHSNPESGFAEFKAVGIQKKFLEERGFTVTFPYGSALQTAFHAEYGADNAPTVIFMSEYDALEGLGHGCGHNLIATAALQAFLQTAEAIRQNKINAKAILLGTPAEEGMGGKAYLIEKHAFDNTGLALISHPYHLDGIGPSSMGISHLQVEFFGKSAHASMAPEHGINALDAMISLFNSVALYRQQMPKSCQIHGIITDGGKAANIIPDYTKALFYTRSFIAKEHHQIDEDFKRMVHGAAMSTGCNCKLGNSSPRYDASITYPELEKAMLSEMLKAGLKNEKIDRRLSSDFGNVSQLLPTVNIFFAVSETGEPQLHTIEFREAAGTVFAFNQAVKAGNAMAQTALRFMTEPDFRQAVKLK